MSVSTPNAAIAVVPIRRALHRWIEIGAFDGASSLNRAEQRTLVGLQPCLELGGDRETRRALANPSAISSGVKTRIARA